MALLLLLLLLFLLLLTNVWLAMIRGLQVCSMDRGQSAGGLQEGHDVAH